MDISSLITGLLAPFVPAPVLSFARSYLPQGDISQSTLGSYAPSWLIEQLPLLLSLIAGYVAIMSAMRAARVAFRYFLFFAKYGGIALFGTLLYSLYQGDTTALRSTLTTATSVASSAASLGGLSSLASVAAWWIGADNTEAVKNVGAYAAKFFSPDSSTATTKQAKKSKKKQSNSNIWDSFLPNGEGSGSPSGNTRSKKKVDNPNSLFEDVFGETPKRAGGGAAAGDAGGIVNGFLDKVVHAAGGENALKLKKLAEQALAAGEGEKEADKGWGFGQGSTR